jgi:hypothetical protein
VTTAVALPTPASPLPHRTDWQGVRDAIELFILERRADKKQPSTIRYYRQQLGLFCAWLTQQEVPGDGPEDVTKALILAYRLHLQERGHTRLVGQPLQHTTLVASQRAVRTFFAWAEEEGYVIDGRILKLRKTGEVLTALRPKTGSALPAQRTARAPGGAASREDGECLGPRTCVASSGGRRLTARRCYARNLASFGPDELPTGEDSCHPRAS